MVVRRSSKALTLSVKTKISLKSYTKKLNGILLLPKTRRLMVNCQELDDSRFEDENNENNRRFHCNAVET